MTFNFKRDINILLSNSFFLFGPRQTGKSSLVRAVLPVGKTLVFDLLKSDEYQRLLLQPALFREEIQNRSQHVEYIFVDEIQRLPQLLDDVHFLLENPRPPIFALTGSSARKLKRAEANMLGGRAFSFNLFPLTHNEMGDKFYLDRVLRFGSLPKIYLSDDTTAELLLRSYVDTYLKEEIEAEAAVRSTGIFIRFLFQAGHASGEILNYSAIGRQVGTSHKTVRGYYQILEDTLLGRFLFAYNKSLRERLVAHPKFYFFDIGVQRALARQLSVTIEPETYAFGKLFEHFIINEIFRINDYMRKDCEFSFYRTEAGAEVDLVIESPVGETFAVEIKSSISPPMSELRAGFESFKGVCPKAKRICVCRAPNPRKIDDIEVLPFADFFALFKAL